MKIDRHIYIDYQGGAHGNFLEFICNKYFTDLPTENFNVMPFNHLGASHNKSSSYHKSKLFEGLHSLTTFVEVREKFINLKNSEVIYINISNDDLLPLSQVSLLRAGDFGYDNNSLEDNTYNKLNNIAYQSLLDNLNKTFFSSQIKDSYDAVKDPSWPDVATIEDYNALPIDILEECTQVHNLKLVTLNDKSPNCPRNILREFFKFGFKTPYNHGFISEQRKVLSQPTYSNNDVFYFEFSSFYDVTMFKDELRRLGEFLSIDVIVFDDEFYDIYNEFISNNKYINSKKKCDSIINSILNDNSTIELNLDLMEESYIDAKIELQRDVQMPTDDITYFGTSSELRNYIN